MAVTMPREKWTDERLDDRTKKVDDALARIEKKSDEQSIRLDQITARLDQKIDPSLTRIDTDIRELRGEIRGMNRMLFAGIFVILGAVLGTNVL
jgi:phage-related protein